MGQGCCGGGSPPQDQQVRIVILDGAMSSTEQDRLIHDEVNAAKVDARGGLIQVIEYDPNSSITGSSLSGASSVSGSNGPTSSIAGSSVVSGSSITDGAGGHSSGANHTSTASKSLAYTSSSLEGSSSVDSSATSSGTPHSSQAPTSVLSSNAGASVFAPKGTPQTAPSKGGVSRKRPPAVGGKSKFSKSQSNKSSAAPTGQQPQPQPPAAASSGVESSRVSSTPDSSTTGKSGIAGKSTAGRSSKGGKAAAGNKSSSNKKTGKGNCQGGKCQQPQPPNNNPKPPKMAHFGIYKTDSSEFASPYRFPAEPSPVNCSVASSHPSSPTSSDDDDGGTAIGNSKNTIPHPKISRPKVKLKPASARSTSSSTSGRSIGNWRSISEESITSTGASKKGDVSKKRSSKSAPVGQETQQARAEGCTIRHREDPNAA